MEPYEAIDSRKYLSLDEIDLALYSIYWYLLKGYPEHKISSFIKDNAIHFCGGISVDCGNQIEIA